MFEKVNMAQSVTGGGLHGKDLSKADVSVNIYAFLKAQETGEVVSLCCAIGVDKDGKPKTTAKPNPNIKKRHDNALLYLKYFNELGLTPLARARAGVRGANAKKEADIFAELLQRTDE